MADAHTHSHDHTPAHDHGHGDAHAHPHVNYFLIFIALCICTAISVAFDLFKPPKSFLVIGVLAVAVAKALFVMTYFMHLKFEGAWKFIILAPTAILAVGLMVALAPDMAMHYYSNDAPQLGWNGSHVGWDGLEQQPAGEDDHQAEHDSSHGHGH